MFEEFVPKRKIGMLSPLSVIENAAYEFYRLAPPGIMLVMVPLGLQKFSAEDVERVFAPLDHLLDMVTERGVDIIVQSGIPLPILIGVEAHDRMIAHIEKRTGLPARSQIQSAVDAAAALGIRRIAFANKWSEAMNASMGEFFARAGIEMAGATTEVMAPSEFQRLSSDAGMQLAYELGRQALKEHGDADGLLLGGGAWISQPVAQKLEEEFEKPVFCNQEAMIWDVLHRLDIWQPLKGRGRLLALA